MNASRSYPRVLIVAANPISRVQSVGLLLRSNFTGWPRDRLAQIYFPLFHSFPPDTDVCPRSLRVNFLGLAREENGSASTDLSDASAPPASSNRRRMEGMIHRVTRTPRLRAPLVDPLREALTAYPWLDRRLVAYARQFDPDVIYSLMGTIGISRATAVIARELGRPVVPHITDNWLETRFVGSPFGQRLRQRLRFWLQEVMDQAPILLAVSGVMAREYGELFDKEGHPMTAVVDEEPFLAAASRGDVARKGDGTVRLVYTGNLALERWRSIRLVGEALERLRAEGLQGSLDVYCSEEHRSHYGKSIEIDGVVRVRPWVPATEVPRLLVGADVLVHAESSDPAVLEFTRHSFSTKLSQYLIAGRCILLVGPAEAGAVREIKRIGGAVVVGPDGEEVSKALRRLLADAALREQMGREAREVGRRHFEARHHRERFRTLLAHAAASGPPGRAEARSSMTKDC